MKFLSWMHHKLMQSNTETMKNSTIGNPSSYLPTQTLFDEKYYSVEPTNTWSHSYITCQKSSNQIDVNMVELPFQEESLELFDFLSIGTFGIELPNAEPPTPAFPMQCEGTTNQPANITENDLKQISFKLEQFLEAEETEIANDTSSRSSQASIINLSLSNKHTEGSDLESHKYLVACPLQNYLFANATGLAEKDTEVKKEKTSLEELFKRNIPVHDDYKGICEKAEQQYKKRNAGNLIKKMVKKFSPSTSSSTGSLKNESAPSISIKKKLSKVLKKLHKKVHPEEMEEQIVKLQKADKKKQAKRDAYQITQDNENKMVLWVTNKKSESTTKLPSNGINKGASTNSGGHWIKTDSDYLVLEL